MPGTQTSRLSKLSHISCSGGRSPARSYQLLALCSAILVAGNGCFARPPQAIVGGESVATQGTAVGSRTEGKDWPSFLGPSADGTSSETGIDPARWQPAPPLVWSLPLGVSYGAPTVVDGKLYQFDRFGTNERLTCFVAETAEELWRWESKVQYDDMYGYNNGPRCSPIVDGNLVFVYGVAGQLSCVDANSGKLLWTKDMLRPYGVVPNFFGVASNPCVFEDRLLVMVGGSTAATRNLPTEQLRSVRSDGSAIIALDKRTGQELYRAGDGLASYASLRVVQLDGKPTGLAFLRDGLLAWDPASGKSIFNFPWRADMLESVNAAMPLISGNRIFVSEAYEVGSALIEVKSGSPEVVWKDSGPRSDCRFRAHWSTPVLHDGYLYGCCGRNGPDTDFRCVRLADGEVMWKDRDRERDRTSVLLADGYLIVLGEFGRLELVRPDPEKFDLVARVELSEATDSAGNALLDYPCWAAPVLSRGLLYLRGNSRLNCFDLIPQ